MRVASGWTSPPEDGGDIVLPVAAPGAWLLEIAGACDVRSLAPYALRASMAAIDAAAMELPATPEARETPVSTATPEAEQTPEAEETPEAGETPVAEETPATIATPVRSGESGAPPPPSMPGGLPADGTPAPRHARTHRHARTYHNPGGGADAGANRSAGERGRLRSRRSGAPRRRGGGPARPAVA